MRSLARVVAVLVLALASVASPAAAAPKGGGHARARKGPLPQSSGAPNRGKLVGAARLRPSRQVEPRPGSHSWGLPTLVATLKHAADAVASKHKGSVLLVGDLSAAGGGPLSGHKSHQSGRDADVGFFVASSKGRPVRVHHFIAFNGEGKSRTSPAWARFDDARNWTLVEALLEDRPHAGAAVHFVFVSNELKARLLAYATKKHVSKDLLARAAAAMLSPEHVDVHDDHFHVRIHCPAGMSACVEEAIARSSVAEGSEPDGAPVEPVEPASQPAAAPEETAQ